MATKPYLSIDTLRQLIAYDPETGALTWKPRTPEIFEDGKRPREWTAKIWNSRHAGNPALAAVSISGYLTGAIFWRNHTAHRVAFAVHYGRWPKEQIDHINGIRSDNRIGNLREATSRSNSLNMGISSRNTSGRTGVEWIEQRQKWRVSVQKNGKAKFVGRYDDFADAVAAREAAEAKYGYHKNTRRTAKVGEAQV